jgi:AcrR family transcriptional regulator
VTTRSTSTTRQDRRHSIVKAAASVFATRGYLGTRVADIATAAEVGKGTVYEYFASKEEVLFAVWEWIADNAAARIRELPERGGDRERLAAMFALSAEIIEEQVEQHAASMEFWGACRGTASEERFRTASVTTYATFRRMIADTIRAGQASGEFRAGIDAEAVAAMIVSAHDGLGIQYYFDRSIDPRKVMDHFAQGLCEGLCTSEDRNLGDSTT